MLIDAGQSGEQETKIKREKTDSRFLACMRDFRRPRGIVSQRGQLE
jgi:hypothetical protein